MSLEARSPTQNAMRYEEVGTGWSQLCVMVSSASLLTVPRLRALMRTVAQEAALTVALYVIFAAGASWHGRRVRAWMAWHCVNMYGLFLPSVWLGGSH